MISATDLEALLRETFPDAQMELTDLTGGMDHWQVAMTDSAFAGKTTIARHRLVYAAVGDAMAGPIHALSLTLKAPGEA